MKKSASGDLDDLLGGLEPGMPVAAMVGHDVEQIAHVSSSEVVAQVDERLVAAKMGIDVAVVGDIIFVVGVGGKDGIQVEGIDAKFLNVVELFGDTGQVAAVKHDGKRLVRMGWFTPGVGLGTGAVEFKVVWMRVGAGVAVVETVGEYLVENGRSQPIRAVIIG